MCGLKQSFDTAIGLIRRGGVIGRVGLPHDVEISAEGTFYGNIGIKGGPAPVRHYDIDGGLLDAVAKARLTLAACSPPNMTSTIFRTLMRPWTSAKLLRR